MRSLRSLRSIHLLRNAVLAFVKVGSSASSGSNASQISGRVGADLDDSSAARTSGTDQVESAFYHRSRLVKSRGKVRDWAHLLKRSLSEHPVGRVILISSPAYFSLTAAVESWLAAGRAAATVAKAKAEMAMNCIFAFVLCWVIRWIV